MNEIERERKMKGEIKKKLVTGEERGGREREKRERERETERERERERDTIDLETEREKKRGYLEDTYHIV